MQYIDKIASHALSLFALLINLGHSKFIHEFMIKDVGQDALLESWIGKFPKDIIPEFWDEFKKRDQGNANIFGVEFKEELPRYCPPNLDSAVHVEWGSDRILPFMNETLIGQTGNSRVYAFEIHDEYRQFKHLTNVHNIDQFESTTPAMNGRRSSDVPEDVVQRAFGIHSDLKPANILVEEDNKWVISDFGQAAFRDLRSRDETSSIENRGGSITYAPPEYDDGIHKRSFDIFSLGIIFLEVAAFVIRSYPGLTSEDRDHPGLDKARITEDSGPHGGENHRFYLMDQSRNYRLKEEIGDFMDDLQCDVDKGSSDHLFVTDLFRLIRRMLSCNPSGRPLATEVEQELSRLIKDYGNEANDFQTEILQKTHRERYNQRLQEVGRKGYLSDKAVLKKAFLVPQYAFTTEDTSTQSVGMYAKVTFPGHKLSDKEDNVGIDDYEFSNEDAAVDFQSILTGQLVRAR
ncbi:hypothetical protein SLS55_000040 [Diplodia seriata]|uniref:Protein kinase domain-containing protein n=1 Tax=Diplodia seriata TaxID=420778 RepID=A0ABR3CT62_9PEZI